MHTESQEADMVIFSCGGEKRRIHISEILYFQVQNRIVTVYLKNDSFEVYATLDKIQEMFVERGFIRIHRSSLVSGRYIRSITRKTLTLIDGTKFPIGATYLNGVSKEFQKGVVLTL